MGANGRCGSTCELEVSTNFWFSLEEHTELSSQLYTGMLFLDWLHSKSPGDQVTI